MADRKENKIIKKAGRKEISYITWMYLKSYGMKMNRQREIIPVINAVIFAINELLKNNIEITISGFGNFYIKENNHKKSTLNGVDYESHKKRRVHFKYTNKVFK